MAKKGFKGFEILSMEDRSEGMSEGKLYLCRFRCYHKKKWVELEYWIMGKNEADCREKATSRWSRTTK